MFDPRTVDSQGAAGLSRNRYVLGVLGALAVAALAALTFGLMATSSKASHNGPASTPISTTLNVTPQLVLGNVGQEGRGCTSFNANWTGEVNTNDAVAENEVGGPYVFNTPEGQISVTIHGKSAEEPNEPFRLDWTSTFPIDAVFVKGGPDANEYNYVPPADGDTGLGSPGNAGISHYMFCWEPRDDGDEGCTPGYWKQSFHFFAWTAPYTPTTNQQDVFGANAFDDTLLAALNYGGGKGVNGGKQILLRAAVAALLNAASPDVDYALTTAQVISEVTAALNSGNRDTMLALAEQLDADNNAGCTLGRDPALVAAE